MKRLIQVAVTTGLSGVIWVFPSAQKLIDGTVKAESLKDANSTLIAQVDLQQIPQLIQQNPEVVQQAQQLLQENPELVRSLVQQLIQQNPELLEQLQANPELVEQIAGQNPQLIQQLQQNPQLLQQLQQQIQYPSKK